MTSLFPDQSKAEVSRRRRPDVLEPGSANAHQAHSVSDISVSRLYSAQPSTDIHHTFQSHSEVIDYVKPVKIQQKFETFLWGQLATRFPDISIFSGKDGERTLAAKETLLQSAPRWPDIPRWACFPKPG